MDQHATIKKNRGTKSISMSFILWEHTCCSTQRLGTGGWQYVRTKHEPTFTSTIMNLWNCFKRNPNVMSMSDVSLWTMTGSCVQLWVSRMVTTSIPCLSFTLCCHPETILLDLDGEPRGALLGLLSVMSFWIEHRRVMTVCLEQEWIIWEMDGDLHKSQ